MPFHPRSLILDSHQYIKTYFLRNLKSIELEFHMQSKEEAQESLQSSTTSNQGPHMGKQQKHNKRSHTRELSLFFNTIYWPFQGGASFVDPFCHLCFVFVMLSCLFTAALWSPAGKGLTSWLSSVWRFTVFLSLSHVVSLSGGVLGCIIPDLCLLTLFSMSRFVPHD